MASFCGARPTLEKKAQKAGWVWASKAHVGDELIPPSKFMVVFEAYRAGALAWLLASGRRLDKGIVVQAA